MSAGSGEHPTGHRREPAGGPRVRTDVVDVYLFRRAAEARSGVEFLQLLRASEPLGRTWQPLMGHVESRETAPMTALRELREEVGLDPSSASWIGLWALEQVHPFYIAAIDSMVFSPRFACEVAPGWSPILNDEHSGHRWVDDAASFMWPGQRRCLEEILSEIVPEWSLARDRLRVDVRGIKGDAQ